MQSLFGLMLRKIPELHFEMFSLKMIQTLFDCCLSHSYVRRALGYHLEYLATANFKLEDYALLEFCHAQKTFF